MRIAELGHAGLHVHDLGRMRDFYERVLGLRVTDEDPELGLVFLSSRPEVEHHEFVLARGRTAPADVRLLNQISWRVKDAAACSLPAGLRSGRRARPVRGDAWQRHRHLFPRPRGQLARGLLDHGARGRAALSQVDQPGRAAGGDRRAQRHPRRRRRSALLIAHPHRLIPFPEQTMAHIPAALPDTVRSTDRPPATADRSTGLGALRGRANALRDPGQGLHLHPLLRDRGDRQCGERPGAGWPSWPRSSACSRPRPVSSAPTWTVAAHASPGSRRSRSRWCC